MAQEISRRYKCVNPDCKDDGADHEMTVNHNHKPSCDKCKSARSVYELSNICLLREDANGKIIGENGAKFSSACGKFSLPASPNDKQAFSGEVSAVNCPHCLAVLVKESSEGG